MPSGRMCCWQGCEATCQAAAGPLAPSADLLVTASITLLPTAGRNVGSGWRAVSEHAAELEAVFKLGT